MDIAKDLTSHSGAIKTITKDRILVGKFLYKFAWIIEVFAIIIGLAIALMTMTSSFTEMQQYAEGGLGFGEYTNIFIAAIPFIMVSVVEATKIPFVEAYYKTTKLKWKIIFGVSLLFIAIITFESAINGFERNFNSLMYGVDKTKKELVNVNEQIPPLKEQREKLSSWTSEDIEKNYSNRNAQLSKLRQDQSLLIQDRIEDLRATTRTEYILSLKERIKDKKNELGIIYKSRDSSLATLEADLERDLNNASSELTSKRRTLQAQLSRQQQRLADMEKNSVIEIENASIFSVSKVEKKWVTKLSAQEKLVSNTRENLNNLSTSSQNKNIRENFRKEVTAIRSSHQEQIERLNRNISELNLEISKSVSKKEKEIEKIVVQHQQELKNVEDLFFKQQQENKDIRTEDYKRFANNKDEVIKLDAQILTLDNKRVDLRNIINVKVGDNQIYRMAQWFYGKESAADIDRSEVVTIASIWFGSLAFLIAFTGILLALASFVIRDDTIPNKGDEKTAKKSNFDKLVYTIRRWIYFGKKMKRQPVYKTTIREVVKEVPVEKVVFKDKVIEVIRKELVHVPLYTNDKSLINISNSAHDEPKHQSDLEIA